MLWPRKELLPVLYAAAIAFFAFGVFVGCSKSKSGSASSDPYSVCPTGMVATTAYGCTYICENLPAGSSQQCINQADVGKYAGQGKYHYWQGFIRPTPGANEQYKDFLRDYAQICDFPGYWSTSTQCHMWDGGGQATFITDKLTIPTYGTMLLYLGTDNNYGNSFQTFPVSVEGNISYANNKSVLQIRSLGYSGIAMLQMDQPALNKNVHVWRLFYGGTNGQTEIATIEVQRVTF